MTWCRSGTVATSGTTDLAAAAEHQDFHGNFSMSAKLLPLRILGR